MINVSRRGVPYVAILCSSIVGFLCVIMSGIAPGTVFIFLLNSSGAIVLFVYMLIALSQIVLRLKTPPEKLRVKMWFFPVLSILTLVAIVAVLVQMAFDSTARIQFWLGLLSWAVMVALYLLANVAPPRRTRRLSRARRWMARRLTGLGQQHRLFERQPAEDPPRR